MVSKRAFRAAAGLIWAVAFLALAPGAGRAADAASPPDTADGSGRSLYPIPILFYTPETELAGGASLLYIFGGDDPETRGRPSSLSVLGLYTGKKQSMFGGSADLWLDRGRTQLTAALFYKNFPTEFYGIGNGTPETNKEDYTPREVEVALRVVRRIHGPWQIGATALAHHLELHRTETGGELDGGAVPGTAGGWALGFGALAGVDTRDAVYSARRGVFAEAGVEVFDTALGSDFGFTRWRADLRAFRPLFGSHVLAVRALGLFAAGSPPFHLMPQLGGAELARGYYEGRYRDRDLVAAQVEYRFPVYGPVSMAAFASAGQVGHRLTDLRVDAFHWGGGFGFRYLLSEENRLILRMDQGYGGEDGGFYVSFGEAF